MAEVGSKVESPAKKAPAVAEVVIPVVSEDKPEVQVTEQVAATPAETATLAVAKAPVAAKAVPAKRAPAKKPAKVAKPASKAVAAAKPVKPAAKKASKPVTRPAAAIQAPSKPSIISTLKEKNMPKTAKNAKIAVEIQEIVAKAQAKAKQAAEKGAGLLGEASTFTKGNAEAVAASGKILASGFKAMGQEMAADTRDAFKLVTGEVKELTAVKSPAELVKVQGEIVRKNLDTAIALSSKNTQAMLKLAGEAFAPISGRFALAAEKVRKAAA